VMTDWSDLARELDCWAETGRAATFWWRDDDAGPDDGLLLPFVEQRQRLDVPLALAVVPGWLTDATTRVLSADPGCQVLQHGIDHSDRTTTERRKAELCEDALGDGLEARMAEGRAVLAEAFGTADAGAMVPPWNRIDAAVAALLPDLGFCGLSTLGPRPAAARGGLALANVHIDIVDWKGGRGFAGDATCLAAAVDHLAARRTGRADADEPTGLMTHHRVHDDETRRFVDSFVTFVRDHPAARWLAAADLFLPTPGTP